MVSSSFCALLQPPRNDPAASAVRRTVRKRIVVPVMRVASLPVWRLRGPVEAPSSAHRPRHAFHRWSFGCASCAGGRLRRFSVSTPSRGASRETADSIPRANPSIAATTAPRATTKRIAATARWGPKGISRWKNVLNRRITSARIAQKMAMKTATKNARTATFHPNAAPTAA